MANVVEILIRAKNEGGKAFAEADGQANSLGKTLSKIGTVGAVAMAGVAVASVGMAVKFQSTMTTLQTQAGVSKKALAGLETGVLSLAGKVGFSPDSLGQALYHIESSFQSVGIKGPKALALLKTAAQGAAVGHADLVDVTNALDAVIASGIGGVKNYSQAMGVLNATVGSGDMKMQDLADALGGGMLAVVKGYGISIKDVGAALAVFGDNNIRGAHAGTMLRMAVQALAVPAKAGAKELQNLGMNSNTLAADMRSGGLLKALQDLHDRMTKNGVTAKEQGQIITTIFGKKAGAGIAVLEGQLGRLESKYPDLTKAAGGFGAAVAANNNTAAQKLKELHAQLDSTEISLGNRLLPAVVAVLSYTQKHIKGIEQFAVTLGAIALASKAVKMISVGFQVAKTTGTFLAKLLSGQYAGTVQVGGAAMQKAGDTMAGAAAAMQKAADTMAGADAAAGKGAGAVAAGTGRAAAAGGAGLLSAAALKAGAANLGMVAGLEWGGNFIAGAVRKLTGGGKGSVPGSGVISNVLESPLSLFGQLGSALGLSHFAGWGAPGRSAPGFTVKVKADIADLQAKLATARKELTDPNLTKPQAARVQANISQLETQIAKAKGSLSNLNGRIATTYVHADASAFWSQFDAVTAALTGLQQGVGVTLHKKLAGGITGAATGGIRSGLTLVGERGAELIQASAGSRVYNHGQTQRMLAARGGPSKVHVVVSYDQSAAHGLGPGLLRDLRYTVNVEGGGDVQAALGNTG